MSLWSCTIDDIGGITLIYDEKYVTKFTPKANAPIQENLMKSLRFIYSYTLGVMATGGDAHTMEILSIALKKLFEIIDIL